MDKLRIFDSYKPLCRLIVNRPIIIKILSGLINVLTCLLAVTIILYRQNWFDKSDIYSFIFWTIPFAIGLSVTGKTIVNLFCTNAFWTRLILIIVIAGLLSFGWANCVALVLGPWIGAFSIPILYLWMCGSILQLLFLDWRLPKLTEKPKVSKVIFGLLSFPLTLVVVVVVLYLFSYTSSYLTRPEKVTYLIPEGYTGNVLVIFNQPFGKKPEYENDRRIYRIPKTGILFTQFKDEEGLMREQYYYITVEGKRTKLGVLDTRDFNEPWTTVKNPHEPPRDSLAVFNPGTMGTFGESGDSNSMVFEELSVGTYNDIKKLHDFKDEYIDSLRTIIKNKNGL